MLRRVAIVVTDVSEEPGASYIRTVGSYKSHTA
jgi:ribosomal protein S16